LWGPHWVGLAIAFCELVYCLVAFVWTQSLRSKPIPPARLKRFFFGLFLGIVALSAVLFLTLYIMTHVSAPPLGVFPSKCPKLTNCVRLTTNGTDDNMSADLSLPILNQTEDVVEKLIKNWISLNLYQLVYDTDNLLQARAVTTGMGFVDDFFVEVVPWNEDRFTVNIQSQSRIGVGDFGVNKQRVINFLNFMNTGIIVPKQLRIL